MADLVASLARDVASDLPLLLIVSIDGPEHLGAHEPDEPDALNVARRLSTDVDAATWHWLPALTLADLVRFTGPSPMAMLSLLARITGGRGGWSVALWRQWRERDIVRDSPQAAWRFADGTTHEADDLGDHVDARIRGLVGGDVGFIARTRRLLACAALEGRRFTAPAIAFACGWDVDEAIDFLDDVVATEADHRAGLVVDDGFVTVRDERGRRHLATYRFERELDWLMLRHHGPREDEHDQLAGRLAAALEAVYGGESDRVAAALSRLFAAAGDSDSARRYQRRADRGVDRSLIAWRARNALRGADPADPAERRRTLRLMIAASREPSREGSIDDGLAFAQAASRLADRQSERADAELLMADQRGRIGDWTAARAHLEAALVIRRELGDRRGEAAARHELAVIDRLRGDYKRARAAFGEVLAIRRELDDRRGEATARHERAVIDQLRGDVEAARIELAAVLEINREFGDRRGEAAARHELAVIDGLQDDLDRARSEFTAVLAIHRELGDRHGEASARHELAVIDQQRGDHERAESELDAVLEIRRELGDRHGEAVARHQLALGVSDRGKYAQARRELAAVRGLYRELHDRHGEAAALHSLAVIDRLQGARLLARTGFEAVLKLCRELGDSEGEAECRLELEQLDEPAAASKPP